MLSALVLMGISSEFILRKGLHSGDKLEADGSGGSVEVGVSW